MQVVNLPLYYVKNAIVESAVFFTAQVLRRPILGMLRHILGMLRPILWVVCRRR